MLLRRYCGEARGIDMKDGTEIIFLSTRGTEEDIDEPMTITGATAQEIEVCRQFMKGCSRHE